jgi:hypothetical protein
MIELQELSTDMRVRVSQACHNPNFVSAKTPVIGKILRSFKNLKILLLCIYHWSKNKSFYFCTDFFNGIVQCFDRNNNYIMKNYEMKHYHEYYLFCKRELDGN